MFYGDGATVAAAAMARRRRRILKSFRDAGAVSAERAVPRGRVVAEPAFLFRRMVRHGVVVELSDGRVYLDEQAEARWARRRRELALAVALLGLALVVYIVLRVK